MQLVLISKSKRNSLSLSLGPASVLLFFFGFISLSLAIFYAGNKYANSASRESLNYAYAEIAPDWSHELQQQKMMLLDAKNDAERNLDALSARLSKLQAHVMRLDAVGSRLANMADLKEIEFNLDETPGIGGPKPQGRQETIEVTDFIKKMDELDQIIQDRSDKLSAIESMLIDSSLQDQITPGGNPTPEGWISSLFGMRTDPITGKLEFHSGIDFAGKSGSPIVAVASGIVTWSGIRTGYGNVVEISHGNGYMTRYAHNKKNLVEVGQKVNKGDSIAVMGSTGRSTGPHVHFEVVSNGKTINPKKYISLN